MAKDKYVTNHNLKELHGSGFEITDGEPDIRGWKVRTSQNQEIGQVDELLFDISSFRVRYIIVKLAGKSLNLISRDVLLPIGLAELHEKDNIVLFPNVTVGHLASLPNFKRGEVTLENEREIRTVFVPRESPEGSTNYEDPDLIDSQEFYNHEHFDDNKMYRSRPDSAEKQEDLSLNAPDNTTSYKRIIPIERAAPNPESDSLEKKSNQRVEDKHSKEGIFTPFHEGVIEMKEHSEVPVISKEARVIEEISINKEVSEKNQNVKDSVRKTEVDIEKLGKTDRLNID